MHEEIEIVPGDYPIEGDSGSEPLIDVNVDSESSPKFSCDTDSRLESPKYLL